MVELVAEVEDGGRLCDEAPLLGLLAPGAGESPSAAIFGGRRPVKTASPYRTRPSLAR